MKNPIGFYCADEKEEVIAPEAAVPAEEKSPEAVRSLVKVSIQEGPTLAYYNDRFNLSEGDIVFVEGKYQGKVGRVVSVTKNFRIKLSDYKRVIGRADTDFHGELFPAESHFICFDPEAMPFEKAVTWFKAPENEEEYITVTAEEEEGEGIDVYGLGPVPFSREIMSRGGQYYEDNRVVYLELKGERGRAIVLGGRAYTVEFTFRGGRVFGLRCDCLCAEECKHEFAVLLQLRDLLECAEERYEEKAGRYFSAIAKTEFFSRVVDSMTSGSLKIG